MSNKQPYIVGPWKGMDLRENGDPEDSYFLGINVDTSNGLIEARPPFRVTGDAAPYRARLHYVDRPGVPKALLAVGTDLVEPGGGITFRAYNPDTLISLGGIQNLSTAFGEVPDDGAFNCSFVDTYLNTTGTSKPVTLITTRFNSYVYDPTTSDSVLRLVNVAADSFQIDGVNFAYWASRPRGYIATLHQSRVYYAGFTESQIVFDNPLEDAQNAVPEVYLNTGRDMLGLNSSVVVWSDEYDPAGIRGDHFLQVDQGEVITGLHSMGEALLVFTDKGLYALSGYSDETYTLTKMHGGVGCVAPHSIVQVGGVVYFASVDGVYAFGGLAAPEVVNLTVGLGPLWLGWGGTQTFLPDALRERLGNYGWPWQIIGSEMDRSNGRYNPKCNQIWWSLPTTGVWSSRAFPVTLVYDIDNRGFNLYVQSPSARSGGTRNSCMYDAAALDRGQRWVTSNPIGDLQEFGVGLVDGPGASTDRGVPMFWVSGRILAENNQQFQLQCAWFKLLSTGNVTTDQGGVGTPTTVGSEEVPIDVPMYFIEGEESVHDQQNDLQVAQGYDTRATITSALACHPNPTGTYFWGTGVWGAFKYAPIGWFTSRASVQMKTRSFRIGVIDDPYTRRTRGSNVHIAGIQIEMSKPLGTRA